MTVGPYSFLLVIHLFGDHVAIVILVLSET